MTSAQPTSDIFHLASTIASACTSYKLQSGGVLAWLSVWRQGADLHMAQLMPLPLTVSCFSKIQICFTFLVTAHLGSPGKSAVKRVCVCVHKLQVNVFSSAVLVIFPISPQTITTAEMMSIGERTSACTLYHTAHTLVYYPQFSAKMFT